MKLVVTVITVLLIIYAGALQAQPAGWSHASEWVTGKDKDTVMRPCVLFAGKLFVKKKLVSATALVTAHGVYEAELNGKKIGNAFFAPGWTDYDNRLQYQQYDCRSLLHSGNNEVVITVGEGWYRGPFGGLMQRNIYGNDAAVLFQLDVVYADGSREQFTSDSSWRYTTGPILHSDIYGGELQDRRIQPVKWEAVQVMPYGKNNLVPDAGIPVTAQEHFLPKRIWTTPAGEQVIDFGQNIAGWIECRLQGKKGDTVTLYHAEVLDKAGNFYTGNLRQAKATDSYVLRGDGEEVLAPHFTWHGFRYVKVEGCVVKPECFTAVAVHSELEHTGSFACSDTLINRLQQNIEWSLNGNFIDIPMDCPQRSERLGWTGDAQVFFSTAAFNRDVNTFFARWLKDVSGNQRADGSVPNIIPDLYKNIARVRKAGVAGWGDAATIIPWTHFQVYGDTGLLRVQYSCMKAWVDYINSVSENGLWLANGYGDWLATGDSTSLPLIDQCFWAWSAQILSQTAAVTGRPQEAIFYREMAQRVKAAFVQYYIQQDGKAVTHTQAAYVLALQCDMLPDSLRSKAAAHLVALIQANGNHISTGFLGTPYILPVLSRYGYTDVAYSLLNQKTFPSWLYPVTRGATTIWEKWDAIRPDSSVQATSFNHYAYGAVGDWLYRVVAGISAGAPGYRHILIQPQPGGGLTWARASYRCSYGTIRCAWEIKDTVLRLEVDIPPGTTATVVVPGKEGVDVKAGKHVFTGLYQAL